MICLQPKLKFSNKMKPIYLVLPFLLLGFFKINAQEKYDTLLHCPTPKPRASELKNTKLLENMVTYFNENEKQYKCSKEEWDNEADTYGSKMINSLSFNQKMLKLYSKAAANTDGIVKNGSALSYSIDKDKSTISINHFIHYDSCDRVILNINANGSSDGSYLYLQNSAKPNYGFELSGKLSFKMGSGTLYFNTDSCDALRKNRKSVGYSSILAKYNQLINTDSLKLAKLIETLEVQIDPNEILKNKTTLSVKSIKKLSDSLTVLKDSMEKFKKFYKTYTTQKLADTVSQYITDFELANSNLKNYRLWWLDAGVSYKLLNNNIFDSTVFKAYKVTQKQFHRATLTVSHNFLLNTTNNLLYVTGGFNFYNGYALETLKKDNFNFSDTTGVTTSFKGYNNLTGTNINTSHAVFNPFITTMYFPYAKQFGLEASFDYTIQDTSAPISNGRFGILYSVITPDDKEKSKTTVGLFVTLTKYDTTNPKMGDHMGIGFRVGVPFNKLINEKK